MIPKKILTKIKDYTQNIFGSRFHGIVLYGSEARGNAQTNSDIDLLVLLDGPIDLWKDLRKSVEALYDLQLDLPRPIHAMPVDIKDYQAGKCALYRIAKKEGILL